MGAEMIRMKDCVEKIRKFKKNFGQLDPLDLKKITEPMGVES